MSENKVIRVGSRDSQLALIQTNTIIDAMRKLHPESQFEIVTMKTKGDKILDTALSKIGEKSLFTKELEIALEKKEVDFVVHSLKDLPSILPEGMAIGAVYKRDSALDAVVLHPKHAGKTIEDLPKNSVIGSSSVRRVAQLKRKYPHLEFKNIRGNLNTRLRKLDDAEDYDAIILAEAGLRRMDWSDRIGHTLDCQEILYAVSQGAMAVECRADDQDMLQSLEGLHDRDTLISCIAERGFLRTLEGGCSAPVAVYSEIQEGKKLLLRGGVFSLDGSEALIDSLTTDINDDEPPHKKNGSTGKDKYDNSQVCQDQTVMYSSIIASHLPAQLLMAAEKLGVSLAEKLLQDGAKPILKQAKEETAQAIKEQNEAKNRKQSQEAAK